MSAAPPPLDLAELDRRLRATRPLDTREAERRRQERLREAERQMRDLR